MEKEESRIYRMMTEQGYNPCKKKIAIFVNSERSFGDTSFEELEVDDRFNKQYGTIASKSRPEGQLFSEGVDYWVNQLEGLYTTTHYTDVRPDTGMGGSKESDNKFRDISSMDSSDVDDDRKSSIHDDDLYDPIKVMPKLIKLYNRIYRFIHVGDACTENEYDTALDDLQSGAKCMDFRYKDQLWMHKEVLKHFNKLYKKYGDGTVVDPSEWTHDRKYTI